MPRRLSVILPYVIFMLGLALRLYALDADSLWVDEIYTVTTSRLDFLSIPGIVASVDSHPPLLYILTKLITGLMGSCEFIARLPAAFLGSLSVPLVYKVGELLWGKKEGLAGAFLLSINAYHVEYSQEARQYVPMAFFALLSLVFLLKALEDNRKGMWIGFAVSTALNLYLHYFAFFILPAMLLLAGWVILERSQEERRASRPIAGDVAPSVEDAKQVVSPQRSVPGPRALLYSLLSSLALVAALYLPWLPGLRQQVFGPVLEIQGLSLGAVPGATPSLEFGYELVSTYSAVDGLPLLLFFSLFVAGLAASPIRELMFILVWLGMPFFVTLVVQAGHHFHPKYALYVLPIYLLTVARGIVLVGRLARRPWRERRGVVHASVCTVTALTLLLGVLAAAPLRAYHERDKEDWRAVAQYLETNMAEGDILIPDGTGYLGGADATRTARGLEYYLSPTGVNATVLLPQRGLAAALDEHRGVQRSVSAVLWHMHDLPQAGQLGTNVEITEFPRVTVVRLSKPGAGVVEDVVTILKELLYIQPSPAGRFDLHLALAEIYLDMGKTAEAASQAHAARDAAHEYERNVELDPTLASRGWDWRPYWDLASTYDELGMLQEAAAAYEQVLSMDPSHVPAHLRLGELYQRLDLPSRALDSYLAALANDPEDPQLHYLAGDAYQKLGCIEEATLAYQEVLRLDPSNEWAEARLRWFSPPVGDDIPHPLRRSLGQQLALLGYDARPTTAEAGGHLEVSLWWQALSKMYTDHTAFVHLTGSDGSLWAQNDTLLLHGEQPTSDWRLGLVAKTDSELQIPHDSPPGEYTILVGVYSWETGERLPVWDKQGQREPDDAITLSTIEVTKSRDADS